MSVHYTIYTLACPISGVIRYVGSTSKPIETRLVGHINNPTNSIMSEWFFYLKSKGKQPAIEEIEKTDAVHAAYLEKFWISQFSAWGFELFNYQCGKRNSLREQYQVNPKYPFIKSSVLSSLMRSNRAKARLAILFDLGMTTIERWIKKKNVLLTVPDSLRIISKELGINEHEILTEA